MAGRAAGDLAEAVSELVRYRGLLHEIVRRDLLIRYKQTLMGFGWAVFMPLLNTAVFSVIFTRVAPIEVGIPYPLFAYSGLLFWNFFATSLRFSVTSLSANPTLVTKVYFPREVLPLSTVVVAFVDCLVASTVLLALMAWYGFTPTAAVVGLPVVLVVHVVLTFALALLVSMLNLFFRDVKYLLEVVISVWMFATSVLYPLDRLQGRWVWLAHLNPMTHVIDAYRSVLVFSRWPDAPGFLATTFLSVTLLAVVWVAFHRLEPRFAENV